MATILAFDVYGTLINTHGVISLLENMIGDKAQNFSNTLKIN
jgi:2-haloacid dehalogenase